MRVREGVRVCVKKSHVFVHNKNLVWWCRVRQMPGLGFVPRFMDVSVTALKHLIRTDILITALLLQIHQLLILALE